MPIIREEEENPFAGFDFNAAMSSELEDNPFAGFDFDAAMGSSDSIGYSFDRALSAAGTGIADYLPKMGVDAPDFIKDYARKAQIAGDEGKEEYSPEYVGGIFHQSLEDMPGFIGEKLAENSVATGVTMFGLTVANMLMRGPAVMKVVGAGIGGMAAGFDWLMLLDETVETHAAAKGIKPEQMSSDDLGNAGWTALQNASLDLVLPNMWGKALKSAGVSSKRTLPELAKKLTTTEKDKIGRLLIKGAKATGKSMLVEGTVEATQYSNMMRTSDKGLDGIEAEELATDFVVGAAGGGLFGSPASVSIATGDNRQRKADKLILDYADIQAKIKSGEQYDLNVKEYKKDFDNLVGEYESLVKDVKLGKKLDPIVVKKFEALPGTNKPYDVETGVGKIRPPKYDVDKNVADIIPELYNIPDEPQGTLGLLKDRAKELFLDKSPDSLKDMLKGVKTAKEYKHYKRVIDAVTDTESSSGETQTNWSFDTLKHKYTGQFVNKFEKIRNKWTRHIPFMGEMGGNVRPALNTYVAAKLEEKNEKSIYNLAQAREALLKEIGPSKLQMLDNSIKEIAKIQEDVWQELNKVLGKDGLSIGHQKGYLTRGIDKKIVKKNQEEFLQSLVKDVGLPLDVAKDVLNNILNDVDPSVFTSEQIRAGLQQTTGLGPSSFEKIRTGKWDKLNLKFRSTDTLKSIEEYLISATQRLASAQAFGADNANEYAKGIEGLKRAGIIGDAETDKLWGLYDALHHVYKKPRTDKERAALSAMKGLSTLTAVSYLGLATISSWTEPLWIPQRVGWYNMLRATPKVAGYALKGIMRSIYGGGEGVNERTSFGRDLIRVLGMAVNPAMSERVDKLMAGDRNMVLNYFFRTPAALFLTQYTNMVRVWTATAGLHMIQDQFSKIDSLNTTNKNLLERELRENALTIEDFRKIGSLANGDIVNSILKDEFLDSTYTNSKGNEVTVRDYLVPWMRKITTDVALEPHAGNRPLWMSNPNMLLLAQLKSFPILFGNTIARRLNHKMNPKFCSPDFVGKLGTISAISAALAMAALAMAVKDAIKGVDEDRSLLETVSAVGVPLVGEFGDAKLSGYLIGPGPALVDQWIRKALGDGGMGNTAEEIFGVILKATTGRVGYEAILGDR